MRIGYGYGAHGDEKLPQDIGESMQRVATPGVRPYCFNPDACKTSERQIHENFAAAIRHADAESPVRERQLAAEALGWAATHDFEVIVDEHSTAYPGNEAAWLSRKSDPILVKVAEFLGFRHIIYSNHGPQAVLPNAIGTDIYEYPEDRGKAIKDRRLTMRELAEFKTLTAFNNEYKPYSSTMQFWQYGGGIPVNKYVKNGDALYDTAAYKGAFTPLETRDHFDLNTDSFGRQFLYTIHMGAQHLRRGWLGEFVLPLPPPSNIVFDAVYEDNAQLIAAWENRTITPERRTTAAKADQ